MAVMARLRLFARVRHDSCRDGIPAAALPVWLPASEPPRFSSSEPIYCFPSSQRLLCWCFLSGVVGCPRGRDVAPCAWMPATAGRAIPHPSHTSKRGFGTHTECVEDERAPNWQGLGLSVCAPPSRVAGVGIVLLVHAAAGPWMPSLLSRRAAMPASQSGCCVYGCHIRLDTFIVTSHSDYVSPGTQFEHVIRDSNALALSQFPQRQSVILPPRAPCWLWLSDKFARRTSSDGEQTCDQQRDQQRCKRLRLCYRLLSFLSLDPFAKICLGRSHSSSRCAAVRRGPSSSSTACPQGACCGPRKRCRGLAARWQCP